MKLFLSLVCLSWTSHLQVRAGVRDGRRPTCPSDELTGEWVCVSVCVCVEGAWRNACWLISRGQGNSVCGCLREKERTVLLAAAQGDVCGGRGNEPETTERSEKKKTERRGVEEAQGQATLQSPLPTSLPLHSISPPADFLHPPIPMNPQSTKHRRGFPDLLSSFFFFLISSFSPLDSHSLLLSDRLAVSSAPHHCLNWKAQSCVCVRARGQNIRTSLTS